MKTMRILSKITVFLVFFVSLSAFLLENSYSKEAESEQDKYSIENVAVNVSGKTPADARNLAFAAARRDAFITLLTRLSVNLSFVNSVSDDEVSQLVSYEQVFDEKMFGNNYVANFKIGFAKDFVDDLLLRKNPSQKVEESAKDLSFLIIPVKILQQKNLLWESGNEWKKSVIKEIKSAKVKNFSTIEADIDNLAVLNSENITKIGAADLGHLFEKYKVDVIYVTFFSYDKNLAKVSVLVRGFEKMRKFQYRLGFVNSGDLTDLELSDKVASKMVNYLSNLNLAQIRQQGVEQEMVRLEIPIRKLGEWMMIKNRIENSGIVSKMDIESVSRDYVKISVLCNNSVDFVEAFAKIGFVLTPRAQNVYSLTLR